VTVSGTATGPNTATYTVTWSGSDAGVAARLEWFEGGIPLNSLTRTGPWSETIMVNITSVGAIETVDVLGSAVAVSLPAAVPALGTPATIALALLLAGSGLAMCVSRDRANELRS